MWATWEVFRLAGCGAALLLALILLRAHRRDASARALALLLVTIMAHLAAPLVVGHRAPPLLLHTTLLISLVTPFALWLLAGVHFDDDFRLSPSHGLILAGPVVVGYYAWLNGSPGFWAVLAKLLALAVVLHALLRIYVGAKGDLVVPRLRFRFALLTVAGTYMFVEVLGELLLQDEPARRVGETVHSVAAAAVLMGVCVLALRVRDDMLKPPAAIPVPSPLDPSLLQRLRDLMEREQVFREEALTIAALAKRLEAQEYKVRQLINAELGFKNFNAFLHQHRVAEAQRVLRDPTQAHLGIAQVAFDVGYASLGPFNRAFRDITGQTPTEFRVAAQGQRRPDPDEKG
jgi:AraC-like DNA-binding protein